MTPTKLYLLESILLITALCCFLFFREKQEETISITEAEPGIAFNSVDPPNVSLLEYVNKLYTVEAVIRAYCPCVQCCDQFADGVTSTGTSALLPGVAVDPTVISYGTRFNIPGINQILIADDTGAAVRNSTELAIEVRFSTHQEALNWGIQRKTISIY